MRALITGAEGFVGLHLIQELMSQGHEVGATHLLGFGLEFPGVQSFHLDILDKARVSEVIGLFKPDVIFHLAGISDPKYSISHPEETMEVNFVGTKNILENCSCKVLLIGSSEVYGIPASLPLLESSPVNPLTPYARSKLSVEEYALNQAKQTILVRSFNHIGPGQREDFVCSAFARQVAEIENGREPIIYVGNLEAKRDFTDVRDIVKAYSLAVDFCNVNEPYNICSGKVYQIREILDMLIRLSGIDIVVKHDEARMRRSDIPIVQGDCTKFRKTTGWRPDIDIEDSLKSILQYWRDNLSPIQAEDTTR